MTAFTNHLSFEFKTGMRSPTHLLMNYLFPLGFYAVMGLVMTQINPPFQETLIPALILVTIMAACILGLPTPIVEARAKGIYRSYKINGVPALSVLAIPALTTMFHALIACTVIALSAGSLFGGVEPERWGVFAALVLLSAANLGALGMLIGVAAASARGVMLWSQLIFLPSMLLGGLMLPLEILPASMQRYTALLPTTHAMQAMAGWAFPREMICLDSISLPLAAPIVGCSLEQTVFDPTISVLVLAAGALLAFALAFFLFSWDGDNRRRHPALALLALAPYVAAMFLT